MKAKKNIRAGKRRREKHSGAALAGVKAARAKLGLDRDDPGFTVQEYMDEFRVTRRGAEQELGRMMERGELLKGLARRPRTDGHLRRMTVFRTPEKKERA